jgi:hypothetical protein
VYTGVRSVFCKIKCFQIKGRSLKREERGRKVYSIGIHTYIKCIETKENEMGGSWNTFVYGGDEK